jgi:hypothetical protein
VTSSKKDPAGELAARREVLLARSARLRDELADDAQRVQRGAAFVDRGASLARSGLLVPLAVAAGVLLVVGRPSRVLRVGAKLLALWPVVRPFVPRIAALLRAPPRGPGARH